ncbi:NAD(P)/FAD-dependent oxidoreductase [Roseovarius phycicola]|uniref:FAD-dependent oxidoreductase n=1 Tax=Roseovarius phycicola TaxID=3080976 RepID=A0ABZ2HGT2_9RHOB
MPDVTILGAGIFGLSIAWFCRQKGASVRVIDPNGPGSGASGGVVGALAPHVPENWNEKKAFQLDSLLMAEEFWSKIETLSGHSSGYARSGRVQPINDERTLDLARAREVSANELWGEHATWQVVGEDAVPLAPRSKTGFYIHDSLSASLHPRHACYALTEALKKKGVSVVADSKAQGQVIHATGAHGLTELSNGIGFTVGNGVKGQAALLDFAASGAPQVFADSLHVIFHKDGTTAVGSTSEREFMDAHSTDEQLDEIVSRARYAVPALSDAPVIARWAGLRPRAKSRAPMLGRHPLYQGQFITNGGFKIGFGMAPKVGQVMADLVLDGKDSIPQEFKPEASLPTGWIMRN